MLGVKLEEWEWDRQKGYPGSRLAHANSKQQLAYQGNGYKS